MREKCTEGGLPLFPLILFYRLRGDSSGGFGTVGGLNVGRRRGDRAPCFAARHAEGDGAARQERKDDRLDDFVDLLIAHNGLGFDFSALLSECPFLNRPD